MNEDKLHELARRYMSQFPELEQLSLDEFLMEYRFTLTDEQYRLGVYILGSILDND
jgi:nucleotidyltransferase/DNA polymerase involved in DNA repair